MGISNIADRTEKIGQNVLHGKNVNEAVRGGVHGSHIWDLFAV
jgi:hypothetical protein